jgi:hypothetical protein
MTAGRIFLGLAMMPYAIDKLFDLQFKVPAWSYAQPLGSTRGSTLVWAMFGYSPHLQMLLGVFELIPALLLLNVRTRRLGALLMFPVLLNVFLINFFLHFWLGTKVTISVLLAVDVFLILYDRAIYLELFTRLLISHPPVAGERQRHLAKIASFTVSIVVIALCTAAFGFSVHLQRPASDFTGFPQINGSGTWKIDSLVIAGRPVPLAPGTSFFFNVFNTCVYGDLLHPSFGAFDADKSHQTFQIRQILIEGSTSTIVGTYQLQDGRLLLNGRRGDQPISLILSPSQYQRR